MNTVAVPTKIVIIDLEVDVSHVPPKPPKDGDSKPEAPTPPGRPPSES